MRRTSGPLKYSERKGLHCVETKWWIETGLIDRAFKLDDGDGAMIAALTSTGRLYAYKPYLWDGSSGPTLDGAADPVPSLVHDVLYEAIRTRRLPTSMRQAADALYYDLLRERGMGRFRAGMRYYGLRLVGRWAASPNNGAEYPKRSAA